AEIRLTGGDCPTVVRTMPVDVVLVMDVSGSMEWDAGNGMARIDAVRQAAGNFIGQFRLVNDTNSDQIALVTFSNSANIISRMSAEDDFAPETAFSRNADDLRANLAGMSIEGGTNLAPGLRQTQAILDGPGRNLPGGSAAAIVVLTDGEI